MRAPARTVRCARLSALCWTNLLWTTRPGRSLLVGVLTAQDGFVRLDLPPQLSNLRALTRDLLSEEPRCEEDAAEDQAGLNHRPHRTESLVLDQKPDKRHESG